ncbi:MAG: maltose ABC transporter substrate-binding protein [Oscillospiraceae bacterium]|nr:maltose ABC transporter substrate-binding protein [Oscillospiraceae bacterium]
MKKRILALMLAVVMIVSLASCTPAGNETETTNAAGSTKVGETTKAAETTKSNEKVELVVWESVDGPDKWIEQAGAAFTAQNPNITIKFVNVELGDSSSQIALDGPGGVGPDLFAAPHDKLGELVVGGHILATKDPAQVTAAVLPACSAALTYDGVMYGYPTSAETYALYFNKDLIPESQVPKTWADLYEWCKTFNAANPGKYGFVMDVTSMYYTILFTTKGGNRLFGTGGADVSSSYLATPNAIEGMKEFQKMKEVINLPAADLGTDTADGAFAAGTAAMHISGPWNVSNFKEAGLNYGITTLPSLSGESTPAASFSGTRGMFVSAYTLHPEEANMFAEFLISEEMQLLRNGITGALPAIDVQVESEYAKGFIDQLNYAFPMPSVPQMSAFWDAAGSASSNIWDGANVETELKALDNAIVSFVAE